MCSEGQQIHVWCSPDTSLSARKGQEDLPVFPVYVQLPFQLTESSHTEFFSAGFSVVTLKFAAIRKEGQAQHGLFFRGKEAASPAVLFQLIWWEELCFLLSCPANIPVPFPNLTGGTGTGNSEQEHLLAAVTH